MVVHIRASGGLVARSLLIKIFGTTKKSSKEMEQSLHKKHLEIQDVGIDEDLMCRLRIAQREKKAEAAKKNTANARHKRKRRTAVK